MAPIPSWPWRLEVQAIDAPRSPSTGSLADACKVIGSPTKNVAPSDGCAMPTVGSEPAGTVRTSSGFCPRAAAAETYATPSVLAVSIAKL